VDHVVVSVGRRPSYEDLAAENGELRSLVERLTARLDAVEAELAAVKRQFGKDSSNSSTPPSKDSLAAKAKQRADRSSRERSKDRKRGGQPGRKGTGLTPTPDPDRTERVEPPAECRDCRADLAGAAVLADGWAQVWDVLPAVLEKAHYLLPRRRCGCGVTTTAAPPFGQAGTVSYGPNLNAAAIVLGSEGNVPVERTAILMHALLGVEVSVGFVARAAERLAQRLEVAGFDEAMTTALRAEDVLCGDESPVNVLENDLDDSGEQVEGAPHAITVRTPDTRFIWYAGIPSRSKTAIAGLDILEGWHGYLVRDDYAGWHQFDPHLAGVQQCCAHIIRHCKGVLELHPDWQKWAGTVITVLRDTAKAVEEARTAGAGQVAPDLMADLRARYDKAVTWGITTNRHRDWHKGNHPGYTLAQRLKDKADQVWLFAKNFKIPWTNNASEVRHEVARDEWIDRLEGRPMLLAC
jgi:transposase